MKKINKLLFLFALSAGVLTTSCSEDDATGASMINYTSPTVTLSTDSNSVVVNESDIDPEAGYSITVTASIPESVLADIHIPLVKTGGNADDADYSLGTIVLKANTTSATTNVTIWPGTCGTTLSGGGETLTVGAPANVANANINPFSMDVIWEKDLLEVSLTWEGTYNNIDFCDMDLDLLILDVATNGVDYLAGTSDCTETGLIAGLPDGQYVLIADVYENPFTSLGLGVAVPLTLSYTQCGTTNVGSFVDSTSLTTDAYAPGTALTTYFFMAMVEIQGSSYTVTQL